MKKLFKVQVDATQIGSEKTKDGFLAINNKVQYYTKSEAVKKAKWFDGKVVPVVNPILESLQQYTLSQLSINTLSKDVLKLLEGREVFVDVNPNTNEKIYYGSIFDDILTEITEGKITVNDDVLEELNLLFQVVTSDYLQIITMPFIS